MARSLFHQHIQSLPDLAATSLPELEQSCRRLFSHAVFSDIRQIFLTGCGDSHHAGVCAALAFRQFAGLPCQALSAMEFSRYQAGYLPQAETKQVLVIGISVSGTVSRTVEALAMARKAGAITVAVTASSRSPLASAANFVLKAATPLLAKPESGEIVPGSRSFMVSLLTLYLAARQIGLGRGHLSISDGANHFVQLQSIPELVASTLEAVETPATRLSEEWLPDQEIVFCGAGPNYGSALFSAAKILEASGEPAVAQDLEEWAHLQYFGRQVDTPTIVISAGGWDEDRAIEIVRAAELIGRRLAVVAPQTSLVAHAASRSARLPLAGPIIECFSPILAVIPGMVIAAEREAIMGESAFRAFSGGRSAEGGGGISRIRTSHQIDEILR